jgi:hypothetical protein
MEPRRDPDDAKEVDGVTNLVPLPWSGPAPVSRGCDSRDREALLDDVMAQINRARLLIHTRCPGADSSLREELDRVWEGLDSAIGQFRASVPGRGDRGTLSERPLVPFMYPAWSEEERRWVRMTFYENQAWLARPDLDPAHFASHESML